MPRRLEMKVRFGFGVFKIEEVDGKITVVVQ